ncbi:MAG: nucleotide sugar dehydrogenase [Hyphomicrobium sp.]|nr:nucleotide sugar dehydrogenase [Hyphomicrobium sp.]
MTLHSAVSERVYDHAGHDDVAAVALSKPAVSVIGLGYVGAVSMACLSHLGFRMVGVDISREKVDAIAGGRSPIVEERLGELLKEGVDNARITATQNLVAAVFETDVTFLSVGTPTSKDGGCDFTFVRQASRAIGQAIGMKTGYHVVVLRCSVPPGTTLDVVVPEIEKASGKKLGPDFGVCFNPEFLREGVAVADFFAPPKTVVGASDARAESTVTAIYGAVDKNVIFTSIEAAEMVKYVDNVWHATKVAFGNEVGRLCKKLDIDSHDVMNIFVKDLKLNLSPYYLKPGFAFGGSCLPKEVRAVSHIAHAMGVEVPLIDSLGVSNQRHVAQAIELLKPFAGKRFGFLGVTFKPGTDDMRESPTLDVMATLMAAGEDIKAYDPNLDFGPLLQNQIDYVRHAVPAQAALMDELEALTVSSANALVADSDVVVVSHATDEFRKAIMTRNPNIHVLDLARLFKIIPDDVNYQGIAW